MSECVPPEDAVEQYLTSRRNELADASQQNIRYRLKQFVEWTDEAGVDDMAEFDGMLCEQWKLARVDAGLARITVRQHMMTFRHFIRWCGSVGYVDSDLHEKIRIPRTTKSDRTRDDTIQPERANAIVNHLAQFSWASRCHIVFGLLWHTAMRTGSLRALDVGDFHYSGSDAYLAVSHRPDTDTPLKLGDEGERNVTIANSDLADTVSDYIEYNRPDVEDEHNREPLIATDYGRAAKTTIRTDVYRATQPCLLGDCPHGESESTCVHLNNPDKAGSCPSARSPHMIRRGAITAHLDDGVPKEIVGERASVSADTLEEHYDARSKEQRRQNRLKHLKKGFRHQ
ncbi:site-specific integrase [Halorubrum sp. GN11_10-6_MGM]|uniref:tyrosine-type recombinase/integrase n=1 Tax=Halorubrum sp. GN11_10-6_MGM TaxID=2518112 RepID=UPI0010F5F1CA|nr:site-specific integrase [Halorubrum sp. GN11_10-6_MGM]TKX73082.1 site-specific integrase [Halorubrum sp. GN11_10-6_MGM]